MMRLAAMGSSLRVWVACVAFGLALPALGDDASSRYATVRDSYLELKEDRERQRFRHNYLRIIEDFESFVSDHPDHARAPAALYNAGQLAWSLYKVSRVAADLRLSRTLFRRLADEYPESSLADDGLFLNGRILLEHGGDPKEAYAKFQMVVERFPEGDMAPKAREMLGRLSDHAPKPTAVDPREGPASTLARGPTVVARAGAWQGRASDGIAVVGEPSLDNFEGLVRVLVPVSTTVRHRKGEVPADESRGLPRRIYVDLKPASLEAPAFEVSVDEGYVTRARVGQFSPNIVRIVFELRANKPLAAFPLLAEGSMVIDITSPDAPASDPIALVTSGPSEQDGDAVEPSSGGSGDAEAGSVDVGSTRDIREHLGSVHEVPLSVQAGLKVRRVVIDPGHGGHDVGAVGPTGLQEKEVVLSISKKLGEKLTAHGLEVVYTRTEDVFVPLEARTAVANDERADLFISIHANATTRRARRGVTTYYLDVTSDRYSMRLAARENATTERSVGELQLILADLATRHNTDESARLATRIQDTLVHTLSAQYSDVHDLGVRYALFFVLLGARMPSVLVETSFISNPEEEKRLASEEYRDHVAEGIFQGILAFLEERDRLAFSD